MRRYRRSSLKLRLQCLSRLGPETPLPGRLQHHYEKKVRWSRTTVDFKSTPLEPFALQARVVQCHARRMVSARTWKITAVDKPNSSIPFIAAAGPRSRHSLAASTSP